MAAEVFLKGTSMSGTLYVVSTPIGNLEDITLRALRILREVQIVAAEDTRHSRGLLSRYDIHTPLTSYHDFNKEEKTPVLLHRLSKGESVALISDAGTPTVSDPGYFLITQAIAAGVPVSPIPGPSAVLAAIAASGLPTDAFLFDGFLPKKRGARSRRLTELSVERRTLIFFESPHRILMVLQEMLELFGNRRVALARELTKAFEEIIRGRLSEVIQALEGRRTRGEITLVVEGAR
jgi:16S rRNA (cytidine1402-2'-O)-methyltransferase